MKFTLSTTRQTYTEEEMESAFGKKLKALGFSFDKRRSYWIEGAPEIQFYEVSELVQFLKEIDESVVMYENHIEIYNDYRE